jgi:hypothetical protein
MCKGILIALLALLFLAMCDHYWSDGRYTAAAIVTTKQIGRAYGVWAPGSDWRTPNFWKRARLRKMTNVSKAMELIVAGYVKVRDRRALVDLLAHRRKVLAELQTVSGINPENAVRAIQE